MAVSAPFRGLIAALPIAVLAGAPFIGLPDYHLSFLFIIFFWVSLATSWGVLSGTTGYWSFGHAAFYGAGVYTTATLAGKFGWPFLLTIPAAAAVAAGLSLVIGYIVFRVPRLRGEFFALLTLSVTFVISAVVSNTSIDGGAGVFLSNVPPPDFAGSVAGSIYLLGLGLALGALGISYAVSRSALGLGLSAIHDDEDAAEVKGVPTLRYKLAAFALSSAIAGAVGSVQAIYVGYVTVGEIFSITVPLYVVLMSILGGARHWAGPALGAALITLALNGVAGTGQAELGKAGVALALVLTMLLLPGGIMPGLVARVRGMFATAPEARPGGGIKIEPSQSAMAGTALLTCTQVTKSFGGIHALRGVSLDVRCGEILALVGPNGSGKSTLINVISGHYGLTSGSISLADQLISDLPPHRIARLGIARTYQIPRLFHHLSALENVALCATFGAGCNAADARREAWRWLEFTGLAGEAHVTPPEMNLHARKFLEFARALAARPKLLMLDEVLCGLNPSEIDKAIGLIREIRAGGTTIVFVEHLMRVVVALSDRVAVLDQGKLLALGTPQETMRDPKVVSAYLGQDYAA